MSETVLESPKRKQNPKIYIVGVPIRRSSESGLSIAKFRDILQLAKLNLWQVFATSPPEYFNYLAPFGWKIIEQMDIPITYVSTSARSRTHNFLLIINSFHKQAMRSRKPFVILRPGSPYRGDDVVGALLKKFDGDKGSVVILDAKSGIDIIGDLAERETGRQKTKRNYMSALELIKRKSLAPLGEGMLLVHSLSSMYNAQKPLLSKVISKLMKWGYADADVYIKSPRSKGALLTVKELQETNDQFYFEDHFTLVVLSR